MKKSFLSILLVSASVLASAQEKPAIVVNGETVSRNDYIRRMEYLPGLGKATPSGNFLEMFPAVATLDLLITEKLLLQIAKEKGVLPTEAEIDFEIGYRSRIDTKMIDRWLSSGRTLPEYRSVLKSEIAQFKLQTLGQTVTSSDIEDLYNLSKDTLYTSPSRVRLRIITVRSKDDTTKIDAELKAGKSFESMATLYSTDLSRKDGGFFGEIQLEALSEDVRKEIGPLKKGERTKWVSSGDVFAKFQLDEVIPKYVRPLDNDVKEDLRRQFLLRRSQGKNDVSKWIRDARGKAKIEISNPEFQKAYLEFIAKEQKAMSIVDPKSGG